MKNNAWTRLKENPTRYSTFKAISLKLGKEEGGSLLWFGVPFCGFLYNRCWIYHVISQLLVLGQHRSTPLVFLWSGCCAYIYFFAWCALHESILANENLKRSCVIMADRCPLCLKNCVMVNHLLLHYDFVADLWNFIFNNAGVLWVIPCTVKHVSLSWLSARPCWHFKGLLIVLPLCIWWRYSVREKQKSVWREFIVFSFFFL